MNPSEPTQRPIRILQAASRLIAYYGFDKTTMDDIAREAGVSKGALYLEWPGKDQLFDALIDFELGRLLHDLRARIDQDPRGGLVSRLYSHTLLALKANPIVSALYTHDNRVLGDFIRRKDTRRYTDRLMMGKESVIQMQTAGLLRPDIRPEVMTCLFTIISLGFATIGSYIPSTDAPPLEDIVDGLTMMVEQGLCLTGENSQAGKEAVMNMIDLLMRQYSLQKKER